MLCEKCGSESGFLSMCVNCRRLNAKNNLKFILQFWPQECFRRLPEAFDESFRQDSEGPDKVYDVMDLGVILAEQFRRGLDARQFPGIDAVSDFQAPQLWSDVFKCPDEGGQVWCGH